MRTFTCDEARARLSDALAGDIPRPDAHVLEAHFLDCEPCTAAAGEFLWQDRVIAELAAQARMDVLLKNVRESLDRGGPLPFEERPAAPVRPWRWAAAAALFIGAVCAVAFWKPGVRPSEVASHRPADNVQAAPKPEVQIPVAPLPAPQIKENTEPIQPIPPPAELVIPEPVKKTVVEPAPKETAPVVKETAPVTPVEPARAKPKDVVEKPIIDFKVRNVDEAVRVGTAFLRAKDRDDRFDELLLWTYLHTGVPETEADFQRLLKTVLEKKLEKTYNVALLAMSLEKLDVAKFQWRIHQCAQFLVDNQCQNGQWSYGAPSLFVEEIPTGTVAKASPSSGGSKKGVKDFSEPQPKRPLRKVVVQKKREGPASGDNSNSMYAALGLRACHDADIVLPPAVVELAVKCWRDSQSRADSVKGVVIEGWCYDGKGAHKPYGSMTAGGVGSLVIYDYLRGRDWKRSREVATGLEWLARNFSVDYNPGPYEHGRKEENSQAQLFYYLYAMERAAILFGTDLIGRHDWYAKGKTALLESQRLDGAWACKEGGSEVSDTCFALLFLRKATRALLDVPTSAPKK